MTLRLVDVHRVAPSDADAMRRTPRPTLAEVDALYPPGVLVEAPALRGHLARLELRELRHRSDGPRGKVPERSEVSRWKTSNEARSTPSPLARPPITSRRRPRNSQTQISQAGFDQRFFMSVFVVGSWMMPRLPVNRPRCGSAMMSPSGVTRFCSGTSAVLGREPHAEPEQDGDRHVPEQEAVGDQADEP